MKKLIILILGIVLFFSGCEKKEEVNNTIKNSNGKEIIKIGVVLSLTGDGADYGKRSLRGIETAVKEINNRGGIKNKKVKLIIKDTKSSLKDAVSVINQLISLDKVNIIVGDIISGTTLAMAPIAEKNKVLLFAPGASNPKLTTAGDYIFRNWTSDSFDGTVLANYAYENNLTSFGIITQKTDYTLGLANAFEKTFKKLKGDIQIYETFETNTNDFKTILKKISEKKIDGVFISAYSEATGKILKQSKEINFNPLWYSSLTVDTENAKNIAGSLRNGVIFSTPSYNADSNKKYIKDFVSLYKKSYGVVPDASSGHGYDAIKILAYAIEQVGINPTNMKNFIYTIKNFEGVTGNTSFDENGDVVKDISINTFINNKSKTIKLYKIE